MTSQVCKECLVLYETEKKCYYCGRNTESLDDEETSKAEYVCKKYRRE